MDETPCERMARDHLHHDHYHAVFTANIERLNNYKGRQGYFIKKFLINDANNLNNWRVTWDAIKKDLDGFIGKPVVRTPDLDHPSVNEQEDYRVGDIIDVGFDEATHKAWQISHIFDKKTQEMIDKGEIEFGSPTVLMRSEQTRERQSAGTPYQRDILHRFTPAHDALVGNPAYGKEVNNIKAVCKGDGAACALKLLTVSASVQYRQNHMNIIPNYTSAQALTYAEAEYVETSIPRQCNTCGYFQEPNICTKPINRPVDPIKGCCRYWKPTKPNPGDIMYTADIGGDNTSQLTIVPFVRAELKKHFKAESLAEIVGHIRQAESNDSCLSRKIKIIADEHPSWEHDKVIAVAYSYCGEPKSGAADMSINDLFMPLASDLIKLSRDEQIKKKKTLMDEIARLQSEFKIMLEPN